MKRFETTSQWKLPLIDLPSLAIPEQKELAQALMDLLIVVSRQAAENPKEGRHGHEAKD